MPQMTTEQQWETPMTNPVNALYQKITSSPDHLMRVQELMAKIKAVRTPVQIEEGIRCWKNGETSLLGGNPLIEAIEHINGNNCFNTIFEVRAKTLYRPVAAKLMTDFMWWNNTRAKPDTAIHFIDMDLSKTEARIIDTLNAKDTPMHITKIYTTTFVANSSAAPIDASRLTDDQVYDLIAGTEAEINRLTAELKANIDTLVALVDAKS
jgi:hypothetical protein